MKNLLILSLLLLSTCLLSQTDTTYFQERGDNLFSVHTQTKVDGTETTVVTPITDSATISGYWIRKIEVLGREHAKRAIYGLFSDSLINSSIKFTRNGLHPYTTLNQMIVKRLQGEWLLNGETATVSGDKITVSANGIYPAATFDIQAICLQWIRLTGEHDTKNLYLASEGTYIGSDGWSLTKK